MKWMWGVFCCLAACLSCGFARNEASTRSDELAFQEARESVADLEGYIREYPDGEHVAEAAALILSHLRAGEVWSKYAAAMSDFVDITGAYLDPGRGSFFLTGTTAADAGQPPLPPLLLDDFILILKTIEELSFPGVSIDPSPELQAETDELPTENVVRYLPEWTADTHLGRILYEIDRTLKSLSFSEDNISGRPVSVTAENLPAMMGKSDGSFSRLWFKPRHCQLDYFGNTVKFANYSMGVHAESDDAAAHVFAKHLEINFAEFCERVPAFRELVRVGKLVAIALWLKDAGITLDRSLLQDYQFMALKTPRTTPAVNRVLEETPSHIAYLSGGVDLFTENDYRAAAEEPSPARPEKLSTAEMLQHWQSVVLAARPSVDAVRWRVEDGDTPQIVAAFPLTRDALVH